MIMGNKSKFNVDMSAKGKAKRTYEDIVFDSELEFKVYTKYLLPLKESGVVKNITLQPQFELQPKFTKNGKNIRPINYVADFEIEYADGKIEILDAKGMSTPDGKIKRKLFDYVYPDKILRWVAISVIDGGLCDVETIDKGRKERKKAKLK
jgi:predicted transcriptional regulator